MSERTAIIIKGNPKFINDNSDAERFYSEIHDFLERLGYEASFDAGEPHTIPPPADLWIGHSRGGDRLQFAPPETKTLLFGSGAPGAINHPDDNTTGKAGPSEITPNLYHYIFTDEMKKTIFSIASSADSNTG